MDSVKKFIRDLSIAIISTVIGGILLAYFLQDARFDPNRQPPLPNSTSIPETQTQRLPQQNNNQSVVHWLFSKHVDLPMEKECTTVLKCFFYYGKFGLYIGIVLAVILFFAGLIESELGITFVISLSILGATPVLLGLFGILMYYFYWYIGFYGIMAPVFFTIFVISSIKRS